jgi:adenine-specific DNA-methyltransferase
LDKVAAQGEALGKIANINQGVVSGCDYVSSRNAGRLPRNTEAVHGDGIFVFDLDNSRDRHIVHGFSEKEKRLLRRFYKNSDIGRYVCSDKTVLRLLYIGRDLDSLGEYPQILAHLKRFKPILLKRREVENGVIKFFQLQWPRTEDIFIGEKIVVPYR